MKRSIAVLLVVLAACVQDGSSPTPTAPSAAAVAAELAGGVWPAGAAAPLGVFAAPVPLTERTRIEVTGNYAAAGLGMRDVGAGTISLPLPADAVIQRALLYWAVMDAAPSPALAQGVLNGSPVTGTLTGATSNPCWPSGPIHGYVADVTGTAVSGANALSGFAAAGVPQLFEGASLVLAYSQPGSARRVIMVQDGAVTMAFPPPATTTFTGFAANGVSAGTSWIVADGQQGLDNRIHVDGTLVADHVVNGAGPGTQYWDTDTRDITSFVPAGDTDVQVGLESFANDCITWIAQVAAVETAEAATVSFSGNVNVNSNGVIPIRLLSTPDFDATQVDVATLALGPGGAGESHGVGHFADVDGDGDTDVTLHFRVPDIGLACGDTQMELTGQTLGGDPFVALIEVTLSGC